MARRLFNLLTLLSLLLFVAVCALWVRSYPSRDMPYWVSGDKVYSLLNSQGVLWFRVVSGWPEGVPLGAAALPRYKPRLEDGNFFNRLGFCHHTRTHVPATSPVRTPVHTRFLSVPHWALALLTAAAPASWLLRTARRRAKAWHRSRATRAGHAPRAGLIAGWFASRKPVDRRPNHYAPTAGYRLRDSAQANGPAGHAQPLG